MVAKACAIVMVERGGANEGSIVVLTPQEGYSRLKLLQACEARRGIVVRVSGGGEEGFTGRAAIGYDHGYDGEVFYLGLALDPHYVDGWVEGCLERIGEDHPEEELLFRDLWEDETQREVVIESLKADCEVRTGRPAGL